MYNYTTDNFSGQSDFDAALAKYVCRREALDRLPATSSGEEEIRLMDTLGEAERFMLATPANNVSDLRAMAEIIWQDSDSAPTPEVLAEFFTNLRRLDDNKASRTFTPSAWLEHFKSTGGGWIERKNEVVLLVPHDNSPCVDHSIWHMDTRGGLDAVIEHILQQESRVCEDELTWDDTVSIYEASTARMAAHDAEAKRIPYDDPACDAYEKKTDVLSDDHTGTGKRDQSFGRR